VTHQDLDKLEVVDSATSKRGETQANSLSLDKMAKKMAEQSKRFALLASRYASLEADYRHVIDLLLERHPDLKLKLSSDSTHSN